MLQASFWVVGGHFSALSVHILFSYETVKLVGLRPSNDLIFIHCFLKGPRRFMPPKVIFLLSTVFMFGG